MSLLSFDQNTAIEKLKANYAIILNPASTAADRKLAEAYMETLKTSGYEGFVLGTQLLNLQNGHSLHLRNLGLNFMEWTVRWEWDHIQPQQQMLLKDMLWRLAVVEAGALRAASEESRLVLEKVSLIIASLALKLWLVDDDSAAHWNQFMDLDCRDVLFSQPDGSLPFRELLRRQQLVIMSITALVQLVRGNADLSTSADRRNRLLSGLELALPPVFVEILAMLPDIAKQSMVDRDFSAVLQACVEFIQNTIGWLSALQYSVLDSALTHTLDLLLMLSVDSHCFEAAINVLISLFLSRQLSPQDRAVLIPNFLGRDLPKVAAVIERLFTAKLDESSLLKLKLMLQLLCGSVNRYVASKKQPILPAESNLPSLLLQLLELPSLTCYVDVAESWIQILRNPESRKLLPASIDGTIMPTLLTIALKKLSSSAMIEKQHPINRFEFDDSAVELHAFVQLAQNRSGQLLKAAANWRPRFCLQFFHQSTGMFAQANMACFTAPDPDRGLSAEWAALLRAFEFTLAGLPEDSTAWNDDVLNGVQLFTCFVPIPKDESVFTPFLIRMLRHLCTVPGFNCPVEAFYRVVDRLCSMLLAAGQLETRHRALSALVGLADSKSESFLPFADNFIRAWRQIDTSRWTSSERRLHSELILILSLAGDFTVGDRIATLQPIFLAVNEQLREAQSLLLTNANPALSIMSSLKLDILSRYNHITDFVRDSQELIHHSKANSSSLTSLVSSLQIITRRVAPKSSSPLIRQLFGPLLAEAAAFLTIMTGALNGLGRADNWNIFFGGLREWSLYHEELFPMDGDAWNKPEKSDDCAAEESENGRLSTVALVLYHWSGWIRSVKSILYGSLGSMASCAADLLRDIQFNDRIMAQAMANLDGLQLSDWSVLIRMMLQPILASVQDASLTVGMLNGLLHILAPLMAAEWRQNLDAATVSADDDDDTLLKEVARESALINLSASLIKLVTETTAPTSNGGALELVVDVRKFISQDQCLPRLEAGVASWLFACPLQLVLDLVEFSLQTMKWPRSSIGYFRIVLLQQRLIAVIMGRTDVPAADKHLVMGKFCDSLAWAMCSSPAWQDSQNSLLSLGLEMYKWSLLLVADELFALETCHALSPQRVLEKLNRKLSGFEEAMQMALADCQALRHKLIVGNDSLKSQRAFFKTCIVKSAGEVAAKTELTAKLQSLKKELLLKQSINPLAEEDDGILFNLFE